MLSGRVKRLLREEELVAQLTRLLSATSILTPVATASVFRDVVWEWANTSEIILSPTKQ